MRLVRISSLFCFIFCFMGFANAQEERRVSFNAFGGIVLLPGSEKINNSGQAENIFGGYPVAPMGGLGVNYRFSQKCALTNNILFFTTDKRHFSFHTVGLRTAVKYYPFTDRNRLSPFVSGGLNLNLVTISRREHSDTFFPDSNSASVGGGISVSQINYHYEKLDLSFIPMPGMSAGAGVSYKLTPKISVFAEYNYNYNLANLSSLMKEHYFYNKSNLAYHFASAGVTIKLLKPKKQLLATLTRDAWDGDLTVTIRGSLVYKNPKKKNDKPQTVEMDDIKDTLVATLPASPEGYFEYKNLRADDYKFYLQKTNRKIERADIQVIHDNRKTDIFDDYPVLELIDDFESSNIISRDNNFSVILREGFQHEVDVTVIADNVIGKVTPFSPDTLCRNMLVLLKNKKDSLLAVSKPDNDCGYHFDDVSPGQYKIVFVRDSLPGDMYFSYEFIESPPVIQRQFNTEEDEPFHELYASAVVYEEYDAMDLNQLLLYDKAEKQIAINETRAVPAGSNPGNMFAGRNGGGGVGKMLPVNSPLTGNPVNADTDTKDSIVNGNTGNKNLNNDNKIAAKDHVAKNDTVVAKDNIPHSNNVDTSPEVEVGKVYPLDQLQTGYSYSSEGEAKNPQGYGIQIAAFKSVNNLKDFISKQKKTTNEPIFVQVLEASENSYHVKIYRVILGEYPDVESASEGEKNLKAKGYDTVIRKHKISHSWEK